MALPQGFSGHNFLVTGSFCWAFEALGRDRGVHLREWRLAGYTLDILNGALRLWKVLVNKLILVNLSNGPV